MDIKWVKQQFEWGKEKAVVCTHATGKLADLASWLSLFI
jgi:hypothetical protein